MPDASLRQRLAELIAFDTQNPTGDESPMIDYLAAELNTLGADKVDRFVVGDHEAVFARFGKNPRVLLNAHIDTVPANAGYTSPP
ncbi:MAG TPA: M20 family peptidase, partial [Polyangia bacterium]